MEVFLKIKLFNIFYIYRHKKTTCNINDSISLAMLVYKKKEIVKNRSSSKIYRNI